MAELNESNPLPMSRATAEAHRQHAIRCIAVMNYNELRAIRAWLADIVSDPSHPERVRAVAQIRGEIAHAEIELREAKYLLARGIVLRRRRYPCDTSKVNWRIWQMKAMTTFDARDRSENGRAFATVISIFFTVVCVVFLAVIGK